MKKSRVKGLKMKIQFGKELKKKTIKIKCRYSNNNCIYMTNNNAKEKETRVLNR